MSRQHRALKTRTRNGSPTGTVANAAGKEIPAMFRPEIPKISAKGLQRRRKSVDAHRSVLPAKLQDAAGIDEVTDHIPSLVGGFAFRKEDEMRGIKAL